MPPCSTMMRLAPSIYLNSSATRSTGPARSVNDVKTSISVKITVISRDEKKEVMAGEVIDALAAMLPKAKSAEGSQA